MIRVAAAMQYGDHAYGPKRLQLLKEVIPSASRVALLWNPTMRRMSKDINGLCNQC